MNNTVLVIQTNGLPVSSSESKNDSGAKAVKALKASGIKMPDSLENDVDQAVDAAAVKAVSLAKTAEETAEDCVDAAVSLLEGQHIQVGDEAKKKVKESISAFLKEEDNKRYESRLKGFEKAG